LPLKNLDDDANNNNNANNASNYNNDNNQRETWKDMESDLTVVVKFRSPKVEHLISIWHQCCLEMTFEEYLMTLDKKAGRLHILEGIRLANIFLKRGIKVILVDMSGVTEKGYDISNVIACDVLDAACSESKELLMRDNNEVVTTEKRNIKKGHGEMGAITNVQLDKIDKLLRRYDCNFQKTLEHENLTVLYRYELDHILEDCSKGDDEEDKRRPKTRDQLAKQIIEIVHMHNNSDSKDPQVNDDEYYLDASEDAS